MFNKFKLYAATILILMTVAGFAVVSGEAEHENKNHASPSLSINKTNLKQGEFIIAKVSGTKNKPQIWFNSRSFDMFLIQDQDDKYYRALVPVENMTKPGKYSILAKEESWNQKLPVTVTDNGKGIQKITLTDDKDNLVATAKELNAIGAAFKTKTSQQLWQEKFIYPCKAPKSSPFGVRRSYNGGPADSYHKGLDFAADLGTPVVAPQDGKVLVAGYEKDGFVVHGNTVVLDHGQGMTSIYMHLNKIDVKEGDLVSKGQKIGAVGHTGISTGPHLHWGVYLYGISVDPELLVLGTI
jgi:murein DD-endopeptidase MepM/ murein hydrolase activator NlpD